MTSRRSARRPFSRVISSAISQTRPVRVPGCGRPRTTGRSDVEFNMSISEILRLCLILYKSTNVRQSSCAAFVPRHSNAPRADSDTATGRQSRQSTQADAGVRRPILLRPMPVSRRCGDAHSNSAFPALHGEAIDSALARLGAALRGGNDSAVPPLLRPRRLGVCLRSAARRRGAPTGIPRSGAPAPA